MNKNKLNDLKQFGFILLGIILLNLVVSFYFFRIDLSEDKRYSLSETTINLVENLEEEMFVTVYFHGDFPAHFERIEQAVEDKLEEIQIYGGNNFDYEFIDPSIITDDSTKRATYQYLQKRGLLPIPISDTKNGETIEKILFPGAIINYQEKEIVVKLVQQNVSQNEDDQAIQSISLLEYELANAIKAIQQDYRKKIAFTGGHGEAGQLELQDLFQEVSRFSDVGFINLSTIPDLSSINGLELLVIAQPKQAFSESDKYKMDQFLMNGGNIAYFLDKVDIRPDSVNREKQIGVARDFNLTDQLFTYGVRINETMIQDFQGSKRPVQIDDNQNYRFYNWDFDPIITTYSKHPAVKFAGPILASNVSSIDTVTAAGIQKTPLFFTSKYSKVTNAPIFYEVDQLRFNKSQEYYTDSNLPIAYLLEGIFNSNFIFKSKPFGADLKKHLNKGVEKGSIFICSDGDLIVSKINPQTRKPLPLGVNPFTREQFANKTLISSIFDYQLDEFGTSNLRTKEVKKRPLDQLKIADEQQFWQILNVAIPLLLVIIFGLVRYYLRKKKYSSF